MPVVDNFIKGGFQLAKGNIDKAYQPLLESAAMSAGLPVVGAKELFVNIPGMMKKIAGGGE
jgi:hypothetical protein